MSEPTVTIPLKDYDALVRENESLRKDLAAEMKYRLLLGVRSRIERLELIFGAKDLVGGKKCSRTDTWLAIFDLSHHRMLNDLKSKIFNYGLTIEEFCDSISVIYGDFSDRVAHGVPLPRKVKDKDIKEVTELLEVDDDKPIEKTLIILIQSLKLVNIKDVPTAGDSSLSDSNVSFRSYSKDDTSDSGKRKYYSRNGNCLINM